MDYLAATRDSYDLLAPDYASLFTEEVPPLDRALFAAFAEQVHGPVADVGCGTGWLTDLLHRHGCDAFGIDLSPGMVAECRRAYPHLRFEVGSMLALDLADGALGGLVASYSIIHIPWELRPALFAEFRRVLAPGGQLLLGFQIGDERRHRTEGWGRRINLTWYRQQPSEVAELLCDAGFSVTATLIREDERVRHGMISART